MQLIEIALAADELCKPSRRRGLESRVRRAGARDLVHLDGLGQPFQGRGPKRLRFDIALSQLQRGGRHENGAGCGHLLHAGGQVCRLAHGRVVHVKIASDGAHNNFA